MPHGFTRPRFILQRAAIQSTGAQETNLTSSEQTGTTVANAAGTHTKGAYTTLFTASVDIFGMCVELSRISGSVTATGCLVDIAYDSGGGDVIVIPDINGGYAPGGVTQSDGRKRFVFNGLLIPSGATVKARTQTQVNNDDIVVTVFGITRSRYPGVVDNSWVAYGEDTANSRGTTVPSGNDTFGAWTEIGTTAQDHNLWSIGIDGAGSTAVVQNILHVEIGIGPNSGSVTRIGSMAAQGGSSETIEQNCFEIVYPSSSGDKVWCHIAGSLAVANYGVIIYGGG